MSVKFLFVLFCSVGLIFAESPGAKIKEKSKSSEKTTKDHIDVPNYGPVIAKIQNELSKINLDKISEYGTEIANAKTQLSTLRDRLTTFEKQSNPKIKTVENLIDSTNNVVNTLITRVDTIEVDTSLIRNDIEIKINKISASMSREISDNTKRLEIIEESVESTALEIKNMQNALKKISQNIKRAERTYEHTFESITKRFDSIEKAINNTNQNVQLVYESTLGAAVDTLMKDLWTYLGDFVEFCMQFIDWFYGLCKHIIFWWFEAIQPAIIRQASNLYFGGEKFVWESIEFVHSSMLYSELMEQSKVYLDMVNVSREYNGYVIDAILVLFCVSSLISLKFIIGLCCDFCCPLEEVEHVEEIKEHVQEIEVKKQRKSKKKLRVKNSKNKKPKQYTTRSV